MHLRILFATEPEREAEVRTRIGRALAAWDVRSSTAGAVRPEEQAHAGGWWRHERSRHPERVEALESLLVEKGYVRPETLDAIVTTTRGLGPRNGAQVVARSWVDPAYRERLLADATAAIAELGFGGRQGEHMVAVENTPEEHHLVVCTLCSCYPWPVLGLPPTWYKSPAYRSRAVLDPRGVLADFGVTLPDTTRITVHDSTAEVRYLVVPMRPEGTERPRRGGAGRTRHPRRDDRHGLL